jgi:hypothetical protein
MKFLPSFIPSFLHSFLPSLLTYLFSGVFIISVVSLEHSNSEVSTVGKLSFISQALIEVFVKSRGKLLKTADILEIEVSNGNQKKPPF